MYTLLKKGDYVQIRDTNKICVVQENATDPRASVATKRIGERGKGVIYRYRSFLRKVTPESDPELFI